MKTDGPSKNRQIPLREYRDHCNDCRAYIPGTTHYYTTEERYSREWNVERNRCEWCKKQREEKARRIREEAAEEKVQEWGPLSPDRGHYEGFE